MAVKLTSKVKQAGPASTTTSPLGGIKNTSISGTPMPVQQQQPAAQTGQPVSGRGPSIKDWSTPPPGVSPAWWTEYVNGPEGKWPKAFKNDKEIQNWLDGLIAKGQSKWGDLSPAQQGKYTSHDASGNPERIGTTEASNWEKKTEAERVRETNKTEFSDWENEYMPGVESSIGRAERADKDNVFKTSQELGAIDARNQGLLGEVGTANALADQRTQAGLKQQGAANNAAVTNQYAQHNQVNQANEFALQQLSGKFGQAEQQNKTSLGNMNAVIDAARNGDQQAIAQLRSNLSSITDPDIREYVGNVVSQGATAGADPNDVAAQRRQFSKMEQLSDPSITAQEKLMMELSRRKTESDLKAQRGALKNDLQARGVYGSGAEITQNAMNQQEAANRQALEMLGAQANAQNRATQMLGMAGDLSSQMRGQSAQESQFRGTAADTVSMFNNELQDGYNRWLAEEQRTRVENQRKREMDLTDLGMTANQRGAENSISGTGKALDATDQMSRNAGTAANSQLEASGQKGNNANNLAGNQITANNSLAGNVLTGAQSGAANTIARANTGQNMNATASQNAQYNSGLRGTVANNQVTREGNLAQLALESTAGKTGQYSGDSKSVFDAEGDEGKLAYTKHIEDQI